jgi:hypothetical protein
MSSSIGPYQPGDKIRIPLEVTLNGAPIAVINARVQKLILPDGTSAAGFPASMTTIKDGTYIYETTSLKTIGNYTAILDANLGSDIIECIVVFVIEKPFGAPRIEIACDC